MANLSDKLASRMTGEGVFHASNGRLLSRSLRLRVMQRMDDATLQGTINRTCVWLEQHPNIPRQGRDDVMVLLDDLISEQAKRQA